VVGPESGVKRCLDGGGGQPSGVLARGLNTAAAGKHFVVAVPLTDWMRESYRRAADPELRSAVDPLMESQGLLLHGDLDSKLTLEVTLPFPGEDRARTARGALNSFKALAQAQFQQLKKGLPDGPQLATLTAGVEKALNELAIEQNGSDVLVQLKAEAQLVTLAPAALVPVVQGMRESTLKSQSTNNVRQLALAFIAYADANRGQMPGCVKYSADGKPLWSWRVELLPYLEEGEMYKQLKQDEPWNGPHNSKVLARMPQVFQMPGEPANNTTCYQVFEGAGAVFDARLRFGPRFPASFNQKGTSNVILIAESATPVPWAAPGDIHVEVNPVDLKDGFPPTSLGGHFGNSFIVALADGSPKTLSRSMKPQTLAWAITAFAISPPPNDW
jgi:hypothetical protein